jgi:hypothetical protein
VSSTGAFGIGENEHRSSVGVSRRTVTGTAFISERLSAKVLLFDTAKNRRVCVIWAGW